MPLDGSAPSGPSAAAPVQPALSPETTVELLAMAKGGDGAALERILARCLPGLRRWAHGRLPAHVRDIHDTADLVHDTILSALRRLDRFEARHEGALQAYLREALSNRIKDLVRKRMRRPTPTPLDDEIEATAQSPIERLIGREDLDRYEAALARLRPGDREAIIARIELQYSYDELAVALGKPNANAARVTVCRALRRLADEMRHGL